MELIVFKMLEGVLLGALAIILFMLFALGVFSVLLIAQNIVKK